jgi:O-antigen/teichoic acid export membrane protein
LTPDTPGPAPDTNALHQHAYSGQKLARNTVFSALGELSNLLLLLLVLFAIPILGPEGYGHYSTAFAFVGLFRLLPDLGMSYASTIEISRERSLVLPLVGNVLGFQVVLSIITLALCLSIGSRYDGVVWYAVVALSIDLVLKAIKNTLRWLLKSHQLFGTEAVTLLAERVLLFIAGVWALLSGRGVVGFVLAFVIVRLFDVTALFAYVRARVVPIAPRYEVRAWGQLALKGLPFAYFGAVILAFFQIDTVMLADMRGAVETGWYNVPARILEGLTLVPRIIGYALLPTMAVLHPKSPAAITQLYQRGSRYLLLVGLPIGVFGALASEPLMALFGAKYLPSAIPARWLIPSAVFMFLSNFGETTLACVDRWRTIVIVSTLALATNISLNWIWIPVHGFEGAAWATVITEAIYFAMTAIALHRFGYRIRWATLIVRPVLAATAFGLVLWACLSWPLPLSALTASFTWIVATWALRIWTRQEWDALRGVLPRWR